MELEKTTVVQDTTETTSEIARPKQLLTQLPSDFQERPLDYLNSPTDVGFHITGVELPRSL